MLEKLLKDIKLQEEMQFVKEFTIRWNEFPEDKNGNTPIRSKISSFASVNAAAAAAAADDADDDDDEDVDADVILTEMDLRLRY